MDLKWELGVLLDCYAEKVKDVDEYDFRKREKLKDIYTQAIILNTNRGYGLYYPIDDFIDDVSCGGIIDYDGIGYLLNADGNELGYVRCNLDFLEKAKMDGTVYVAWFNK